jgi:hypothetical protein
MSLHIFHCTEDFPSKVNFVDGNNALLGYNLSQDCCEHAGWYISDSVEENASEGVTLRDETTTGYEDHMIGWFFDPSFIQDNTDSCGEGGEVVFRIVSEEEGEKFIHLFNVHNGFYAHGFEFKAGEQLIHEGCI